jgi:hypothetical protein
MPGAVAAHGMPATSTSGVLSDGAPPPSAPSSPITFPFFGELYASEAEAEKAHKRYPPNEVIQSHPDFYRGIAADRIAEAEICNAGVTSYNSSNDPTIDSEFEAAKDKLTKTCSSPGP